MPIDNRLSTYLFRVFLLPPFDILSAFSPLSITPHRFSMARPDPFPVAFLVCSLSLSFQRTIGISPLLVVLFHASLAPRCTAIFFARTLTEVIDLLNFITPCAPLLIHHAALRPRGRL